MRESFAYDPCVSRNQSDKNGRVYSNKRMMANCEVGLVSGVNYKMCVEVVYVMRSSKSW